jgi:hypothetical protein
MQVGKTCSMKGHQNTEMQFFYNLYHFPSVNRRTSQSDLITLPTGYIY